MFRIFNGRIKGGEGEGFLSRRDKRGGGGGGGLPKCSNAPRFSLGWVGLDEEGGREGGGGLL